MLLHVLLGQKLCISVQVNHYTNMYNQKKGSTLRAQNDQDNTKSCLIVCTVIIKEQIHWLTPRASIPSRKEPEKTTPCNEFLVRQTVLLVTFKVTTSICNYFLPFFCKVRKGNAEGKLAFTVSNSLIIRSKQEQFGSMILGIKQVLKDCSKHTDQNYHSDSVRIIHQKCDAWILSVLI